MYRLWIFLLAIFACVAATAVLVIPANTLYFIVVFSRVFDSTIETSKVFVMKDVDLHRQAFELVARAIERFPSGLGALAAAYLNLCSRSSWIRTVTSSHPAAARGDQFSQPLSNSVVCKGEAWLVVFVLLTAGGHMVTFTFVPYILRLVPFRRVLLDIQQILIRMIENTTRIPIKLGVSKSDLLLLCFTLIAHVVAWTSSTLFSIACYLVRHLAESARSSVASGLGAFTLQPDTQSHGRASPPPPPPPPPEKGRKSFADPAVVVRNRRINQLELELQEFRQLVHFNNMDRAREEHRLSGHNEKLERTNAAQAARIREMVAFNRSIGFTADAQTAIRDLMAQRDDALEQVRKRETELLDEGKKREEKLSGEIHELKEEIKKLSDAKEEKREKDWLYKAYVGELHKWKYIARESITAMKAAQQQVRAIQNASPVSDTSGMWQRSSPSPEL